MAQMNNEPRLLYFVNGPMPSKEQQEDAMRQKGRGFRVEWRNAKHVTPETSIEAADAVAGEATPGRYRDAYPWADDYDPNETPEIGEEFIGDDGNAYVRAVRGDGVAYNMLLSLAAPTPLGSGAPSHGVFAGVDHVDRIRRAEADREEEVEDATAGEGQGQGQEKGQGQGQAHAPPPAPQPKKAKRKAPRAAWNRNS